VAPILDDNIINYSLLDQVKSLLISQGLVTLIQSFKRHQKQASKSEGQPYPVLAFLLPHEKPIKSLADLAASFSKLKERVNELLAVYDSKQFVKRTI